MRSKIALLVVLGACGGASGPAKWQPAPLPANTRDVAQWDVHDEDRWIVMACANLIDSRGDVRCEALERDQFEPAHCATSFRKLRASANTFRAQLSFRSLLVLLAGAHSCDEVTASFRFSMAVQYAPQGQLPTTNCTREDTFGPFRLSPDEARARRGANAIRFADVPSSLAAPIEVCGVTGELTWLTRVACKDGTQPWGKDLFRAHAARNGSTAAQKIQRCPDQALPLDVYDVPCPEQTYQVHMDMYECGPGEQF